MKKLNTIHWLTRRCGTCSKAEQQKTVLNWGENWGVATAHRLSFTYLFDRRNPRLSADIWIWTFDQMIGILWPYFEMPWGLENILNILVYTHIPIYPSYNIIKEWKNEQNDWDRAERVGWAEGMGWVESSHCVDGSDRGVSKDAAQNVHVSSLVNVFAAAS